MKAIITMPAQFIDAVCLAEFDIDKGSVCRVQYPHVVGDPALLAELMLPEGAHNHFQDWTVFMLGRKPPGKAAAAGGDSGDGAARKRWSAHAYRYAAEGDAGEWLLIEGDTGLVAEHTVSLESVPLSDGGEEVVLTIALGGGKQMRLTHHEELQYTPLKPDFACMYSVEGEAVGLHFRSAEDQAEFGAAVEAAAAAAASAQTPLWCLNHVSNRRDATVRRGAQVKALAVCSRFQFIHIWKPVLLMAVDRLYSLSTG